MVTHAAFGGSTNLILHIPAIAYAAGRRRPTVGDWDRVNRQVPRLVDVLPNGPQYHPTIRAFRAGGVPEVMLAVAAGGGRIRARVAAMKALVSSICISSGGSVGREGPIVQICSAMGSTMGQVFQLSEDKIKILVACGAAGGIAATFNAPLAGIFFAYGMSTQRPAPFHFQR